MGHACMLSHSPELAIVVLDEADLLPVWLCDLLPLLWPVEQIIIIIIIIIIVVVVIVIVVVLKLSLTTSSLPTVSSSSTTTTATATTNNNYNYNRVSHKWQKGTAQFSWLSLLCFLYNIRSFLRLKRRTGVVVYEREEWPALLGNWSPRSQSLAVVSL